MFAKERWEAEDFGWRQPGHSTALGRWATLAYGLVAYLGFLGIFVYTVGFVCNVGVRRSIDGPATSSWPAALTIDLGLLLLFGVQHSVMARDGFKRFCSRFVPRPIERSTYVLATCLVMGLLFRQWRPIHAPVWDFTDPFVRVPLQSLLVCGWILVLVSTALINHADLFGLRQVWTRFRGRHYFSPGFVTPGPYKIVRHPLYLGWILAFWATPTMTAGHLLFAACMTAYVRLAIHLEERDLVVEHGYRYRLYRQRTPMLVPFARRKSF